MSDELAQLGAAIETADRASLLRVVAWAKANRNGRHWAPGAGVVLTALIDAAEARLDATSGAVTA